MIFCLMISHKFLKFCLLFFFYSLLKLNNFKCPLFKFVNSLIFCLNLLLNVSCKVFNSIIIFFSSRISVWFFFKTYISVDIFLLFIIFSLTSFSYLFLSISYISISFLWITVLIRFSDLMLLRYGNSKSILILFMIFKKCLFHYFSQNISLISHAGS